MFYLAGDCVRICDKDLTTNAYGRKSVDRIATQSMSKISNLWRLIVVECDYARATDGFYLEKMLTRVTRYI